MHEGILQGALGPLARSRLAPGAWAPCVGHMVAGESLRAHVANGTHRVTRAMLTDEPRPFWEYWEGRLPEVT